MDELSWPQRGRLWLRLGLRLILFALLLWAAIWLCPPLFSLFSPFLLAMVTAWCLSPAVRWLQKRLSLPRSLLSFLVLILAFAALGGLLWWLVYTAAAEIVELAGNWEGLVGSLQQVANSLGELFARGMALLPEAARTTADNLLARFFTWLDTAIPQLLSAAVDYATGVAKGLPSFAVATVVFIMASYFLMSDWPHLRASLADKLPKDSRTLLSLIKRAATAGFGGYLRAQVILSVGVFFILLAGFLFTREPYALLLALGLAILDFIPILGSGTVMVPWAAVDVILGDYRHALGLMIVWGLVALLRQVGEPKILGNQTGLPPLVSLVSVYVGMRLWGVPGMILAPVVCLVALNIYRSGVFDNTVADLKLAAGDISAILKNQS